jgi:hypothetical protein
MSGITSCHHVFTDGVDSIYYRSLAWFCQYPNPCLTCFIPKRWQIEVCKSVFNTFYLSHNFLYVHVCILDHFLPGDTDRDIPILTIFPNQKYRLSLQRKLYRVFQAEIGVPLSGTTIFKMVHFGLQFSFLKELWNSIY